MSFKLQLNYTIFLYSILYIVIFLVITEQFHEIFNPNFLLKTFFGPLMNGLKRFRKFLAFAKSEVLIFCEYFREN